MGRKPNLLDRWRNLVDRKTLTETQETPTVGTMRAPRPGYAADGLTPQRLAAILREADLGLPNRYLELAEVIEERDPHYLGVLATRKRSVSQLDIKVKAASDDPVDVQRAEFVQQWLDRDELQDELFHILDCLGKAYSVTQINWTKREGKWWPGQLEFRDPKGFRFDKRDLQTPLELSDTGQERPLEPFRYIYANIQAKSGLPLRSGLARVAAWGWMFKAFTQRDWAIFTQTYGQPLRVGKWHRGASEDDKRSLFKAVADIAGDCAAIMPAGMEIEFIETSNVGSSTDLYLKRSDWLDQQISKAVVGQTSTTDAVVGGLGSGKEHRQVQEDIERADAKALAAILNRDLIRPWMELEFGKLASYPRLIIGNEEAEDLELLASSLGQLVPLGLKVSMTEIRGKFGLTDPKPEDELLAVSPDQTPPSAPAATPNDLKRIFKRFSGGIKRSNAHARTVTAQQAQTLSAAILEGADPSDILTDRLMNEGHDAMRGILDQIEAMLSASSSLEEFRETLMNSFPDIDDTDLVSVLSLAMQSSDLGGRAVIAEADDV